MLLKEKCIAFMYIIGYMKAYKQKTDYWNRREKGNREYQNCLNSIFIDSYQNRKTFGKD